MNPLLHSQLINDPFGDPGLYIEIRWEKRALLFDLGSNDSLPPAKLLKVSDVFISHTHMDHFVGFDNLLRIILGRDKNIRFYGPPGIIKNVEGKLSGYTWNLTEDYNLNIEVFEVYEDRMVSAIFSARERFKKKKIKRETPFLGQTGQGILLSEPMVSIRAVHLHHLIPSLAFSLEERFHINIDKDRLGKLGLPVGPWLREFKQQIWKGGPDNYKLKVKVGKDEREFSLGELKEKIATITKGQKISYVVDAIYSKENEERIVELAKSSDIFYCEAPYLDEDSERAKETYHLTAMQAGLLAKKAGVKRLEVFHFSPRYEGRGEELVREAVGNSDIRL